MVCDGSAIKDVVGHKRPCGFLLAFPLELLALGEASCCVRVYTGSPMQSPAVRNRDHQQCERARLVLDPPVLLERSDDRSPSQQLEYHLTRDPESEPPS